MGDDDVHGPGQPEPSGKTEQEIFDEQIARASGKAVVMVGGVGILVAVMLSTVALVISATDHDKTVTVQAAAPATQAAPAKARPLRGDALGAQLFISGKPSVGAIGCGSCHTMKAAAANGTIGPNLDKELAADPPAPTRESIVDPNKEIAEGFQPGIMPQDFETTLTPQDLKGLVDYLLQSVGK